MPETTPFDSHAPVRLAVPRHLQDCNGYCGPACVMMVHSGETNGPAAAAAQHDLFRRVRDHAKQANDRRPVKSPAESLLALLALPDRKWEKVFSPEPATVAARVIQAVETVARPSLLLVSKGMHWVVAFGRTLREDGTAAGVLLRDPAWAGMPKFFGLTTLPEKPTFNHSAHGPCTCLESDNPPGSVHERYIAMDELLSPRGLQGSPDWEGKGALALIPAESAAPAAVPARLPVIAASAVPLAGMTPQAAAMSEARDHGLTGRPDSPPDWDRILEGGQPGTPILVKDPGDSRDDFLLVPVHPASSAGRRTAWIMLDPVTLRMREASLLDNWMLPAFPTDADAGNIANHDVSLADGTRHRFKKSELRPNQRNLVWAASGASILPYWPMKEILAPHPVTGEPASLYVTQHGEIHTVLGPEETPATRPPASSQPPQSRVQQPPPPTAAASPGLPWKLLLSLAGIGAVAAAVWFALQPPRVVPVPVPDSPPPVLSWNPTANPHSSGTDQVTFGYLERTGAFVSFSRPEVSHRGDPQDTLLVHRRKSDQAILAAAQNGTPRASTSLEPRIIGLFKGDKDDGGEEFAPAARLTVSSGRRAESFVLSGRFWCTDTYSEGTVVKVLHNGRPVFESRLAKASRQAATPFSLGILLNPNDTVDFAAGTPGRNGTNISLQAEFTLNGVSPHPAPAPAPAPAPVPVPVPAPAAPAPAPGPPDAKPAVPAPPR